MNRVTRTPTVWPTFVLTCWATCPSAPRPKRCHETVAAQLGKSSLAAVHRCTGCARISRPPIDRQQRSITNEGDHDGVCKKACALRPARQPARFDAQAGMLMATDERQRRWRINPVVGNAAPRAPAPTRPAAQRALAQVV